MFFSPIPDHLSHRNTLNHVGVRERKIGHGRSVVILQPCVDVLSLINKPVKMRRKKKKHNQSKTNKQHQQKNAHPSEAITGSLMISCEIGQMNSGGQSDGAQRTSTHSVSSGDSDFKSSSSDETPENLEGQTTK